MLHARYLIGVDSDGTAFDSMNLKHLAAFIPAALKVWPMREEVSARFAEIEKKVNLFSATRGINRFPGLLDAFEQLEREFPEDPQLPPLEDLHAYIAGEKTYSPASLTRWIESHPSAELEKVLDWSARANRLFTAACEGLRPFDGVKEALAEAHRSAAVAVVSSAAKGGLEKDWAAGGLTSSVDLLMSQEDGSKTAQLLKAKEQSAPDALVLMLGDTDSDGIAAHEAGALFFPIMPGDEPASWKQFREEILPLFLAGKYDREEEEKHYRKLRKMLL